MGIFSNLFDQLDPGPRDRLDEINRMYGGVNVVNPYHSANILSVTDGDRLEAAKAARARGLNLDIKEFNCLGCGTLLETTANATHCQCPRCKTNNEMYTVSTGWDENGIDTYETRAKKPTYQRGKTTDNDDIIDIAYEEI